MIGGTALFFLAWSRASAGVLKPLNLSEFPSTQHQLPASLCLCSNPAHICSSSGVKLTSSLIIPSSLIDIANYILSYYIQIKNQIYFFAKGRLNLKVAPWPGTDSTQILPFMFSKIILQIYSPKPVPSCFLAKPVSSWENF